MPLRSPVAALLALLVAACSASPAGAPPASPSAASSSASTPTASPSAPAKLVVGGGRPVTLHVPASYDASQPAPLLLLLHGYSSRGAEIDGYLGLRAAADEHGFVTASPDGTVDDQGNQFWNATDACCNFDGSDVDDVGYLSGIIAEIQATLAIDPHRIAVVGHSNGGFMAYRMACERAEIVSSIVSLAGATFVDPAACNPSDPVSVAQVHGTADDTIRFEGGGPVSNVTRRYPGAMTTAQTWAAYDGCGAAPTVLPEKLDVDAVLTDGSDPAETTVAEWSGCDTRSVVQLWTVEGGSHVPALTPAFADAVIRFLVEHPRS